MSRREFSRHLLQLQEGDTFDKDVLCISRKETTEFDAWVTDINCVEIEKQGAGPIPNLLRRPYKPSSTDVSGCSGCPAIQDRATGCHDYEQADAASAVDGRTVRYVPR